MLTQRGAGSTRHTVCRRCRPGLLVEGRLRRQLNSGRQKCYPACCDPSYRRPHMPESNAPIKERRILLVVATHTASCDSATLAEAGVSSVFRSCAGRGSADMLRLLPRRLMVGRRWSASRSFLLAAARLRGLHLDSAGAASGLAAMRKDVEVWSSASG